MIFDLKTNVESLKNIIINITNKHDTSFKNELNKLNFQMMKY